MPINYTPGPGTVFGETGITPDPTQAYTQSPQFQFGQLLQEIQNQQAQQNALQQQAQLGNQIASNELNMEQLLANMQQEAARQQTQFLQIGNQQQMNALLNRIRIIQALQDLSRIDPSSGPARARQLLGR